VDPNGLIGWARVKRCAKEGACAVIAGALVCVGTMVVIETFCIEGCAIGLIAGPEGYAACVITCSGETELFLNVCMRSVAFPVAVTDVVACLQTGSTPCLDSFNDFVDYIWRRREKCEKVG